jgi:hypothetical protein
MKRQNQSPIAASRWCAARAAGACSQAVHDRVSEAPNAVVAARVLLVWREGREVSS